MILQFFKLLFLFIFILHLAACKEREPNLTLPAKTEQGLNTLGFVVNENVWVNYGRRCTFYGCNDNVVEATLDRLPDGSLELFISGAYTVRGKKKMDQAFYLSAQNVTASGLYDLKNVNGQIRFVPDMSSSIPHEEFWSESNGSAQLIISKFDTVNNIVSGEFKGNLRSPYSPMEQVEIKEGRFDISLNYRR